MKFDLEIACQVRGLTKRAEYPKTLSLKESISLEVAEVSGHDAPMAASWNDREGAGHTLWYDGRHYSPYEGPHTAEELRTALTLTPGDVEGITNGYLEFPSGSSLPLGDGRIVEFNEKERRQRLEWAREWEKDCLIVDGKLYMACETPQLMIGFIGISVSTKRPRDAARSARPHETSDTPWFYSDRYDLTDIEQASTANKAIYTPPRFMPEMSLLVPESLHTDRSYTRLREGAIFLMNQIQDAHQEKISRLHPSILRAITGLSEAMWEQDPQDGDADLLVEALDTAQHLVSTADPNRYLYSELTINRIRETIRRHVDAEIIFTPGVSRNIAP